MADILWKTYAIKPLGFGGIATFLTWVEPGDEPILEVAAFADLFQVTDPTHLAASTLKIPLNLDINNTVYFEGLPSPTCVISWFVRTGSGWHAGPVRSGINTGPTWSGDFPYPKIWIIERLQQLERETLPLGAGNILPIRSAYPRDNFPIPCVSLNFEAIPIGPNLVGNVAGSLGMQRVHEAKGWNINVNLVLWSDTPEERDFLMPWLGKVSEALIYLAPYQNFAEPNFNLSENEDFSGTRMEKPLFIGLSTITGTVWSRLEVPVRNPQGHFTV